MYQLPSLVNKVGKKLREIVSIKPQVVDRICFVKLIKLKTKVLTLDLINELALVQTHISTKILFFFNNFLNIKSFTLVRIYMNVLFYFISIIGK